MDRTSHKSIVHRVDSPASSWALIIGKGGEKLKSLQSTFNVVIRVPRPDAPANEFVTVRGSPEACKECDDAIQEIVRGMSRGKDKKKPSKSNGAASSIFPSKCPLCDSGCSRLSQVLDHLGSIGHVARMRDSSSDSDPNLNEKVLLEGLVAFLAEPTCRKFHEELGFKVDQILKLIPEEQEKRQAAKILEAQSARLTPDPAWLVVEDRWVVRWDETPDSSGPKPILQAPLLDEMLARCDLDAKPPVVRMPKGTQRIGSAVVDLDSPVRLPKLDPKSRKTNPFKGKHMWPFEPSSRLGIAVILKMGVPLDDFHLVCGTSLIKALSGDSSRTKDVFYLQRYRHALCCVHVPSRFHTEDDAGHAVERLLCGSSGQGCSYMASTSLRIGSYRVLVTSEVDACDPSGALVELKSSGTKKGHNFVTNEVALQVALNGSEYVLGCILDADKTRFEAYEWISAADGIRGHQSSFIRQGQRVRLLLDRVMSYECFDVAASSTDVSNIMKLTFDEIRAPVIEPAGLGVAVLPQGL